MAKFRRDGNGPCQGLGAGGANNGGGNGAAAGDIMGMNGAQFGIGYQLVLAQTIP
jgi:hypothetical protein